MNDLMEYLPPVTAPQAPQQATSQGGAGKFNDAYFDAYDAKREPDPKWVCEQRIIEHMLSDLPAGSEVLDCPVGTGRFLPFYVAKGLKFIGADLNGPALLKSAVKLGGAVEDINAWVQGSNQVGRILPLDIEGQGSLVQGDIRKIGLPDKSVDAAVMCRLTRWLSPDDCQVAMRELQRVCRQRIIWTARVANHAHARTIELFEAALSGWKITRNEAGYMLDYRILEARPA